MIHILSGPNSFLLQERKRQIIEDFVNKNGDLSLEQMDGEEVEVNQLKESLTSLPFLASKKLVVLHAPSSNKQFLDQFKELLENVPETTDVVVVEPKLDKRSAYYKYAKKHAGWEEFVELDTHELITWSETYIQRWNASIESSAARELVNRVGSDQLRLKHELDKLCMYSDKITVGDVQELTVAAPSSTIFELIDAAMASNHKRAIHLYEEQRMLGVEPLQIMGMLSWQFHIIALVKAAGSVPAKNIASEAKLNPFVVQKTQNIARNMSGPRIKELISDLRKLDERMKSTKINADDALQAFIMSIS